MSAPFVPAYGSPDFGADPSRLNNSTVADCKLTRTSIADAKISGATFRQVDLSHSSFRNVTFENCMFVNVSFYGSKFEDVSFVNCVLEGSGPADDPAGIVDFQNAVFKNVMFRNTHLINVSAQNIDGQGGYVYFKNMRVVKPPKKKSPIISGVDVHVRCDESDFSSSGGFALRKQKISTSFFAKNSSFINFGIVADTVAALGCEFHSGYFRSNHGLLAQNNSLHSTAFGVSGLAYLVDNEIARQADGDIPSITGKPDACIYILNSKKRSAPLELSSGSIYIENMNLIGLDITPAHLSEDNPFPKLDLRNVTIEGSGERPWNRVNITSGRWDNVSVIPPVRVKLMSISGVEAHKLSFPGGIPWKEVDQGGFSFEYTEKLKPFAWGMIRPPTPEDMGLLWWPSEPGFR